MQEETHTEVTTTSNDGVEINSATPEVEMPVQPETTTEVTETEETRTETTTTPEDDRE